MVKKAIEIKIKGNSELNELKKALIKKNILTENEIKQEKVKK